MIKSGKILFGDAIMSDDGNITNVHPYSDKNETEHIKVTNYRKVL